MNYRLLPLVFLCLLVCGLFPAQSQDVLTNGLIGYWSFDGHIKGLVPEHDGVFEGTNPTYSYGQGHHLLPNSALYLDNQATINLASPPNNYNLGVTRVEMGNFNLGSLLTANQEYSISVWIKPNQEISGTFPLHKNLVMLGRPDMRIKSNSGYFVGAKYTNPSTGNKNFNLETTGVTGTTYEPNDPNAEGLWKNDWYHLVVTYSAHSDQLTARSYIGGKLYNYYNLSLANISFDYPSSGTMAVGADKNGNNPFSGFIDDLRIYNRALSEAEVMALFQAPPPSSGNTSNYWQGSDLPGTLISRQGPVLISENETASTIAAANGAYDNYKLIVEGDVLSERMRVVHHSNWPDYVFEAGYPLGTLEELAVYIQENKHLPGVPSAAEVAEEGIDVAQMDAALLEKVEELSLHLIQLHQQNQALQSENRELKARLEKLEFLIQSMPAKE